MPLTSTLPAAEAVRLDALIAAPAGGIATQLLAKSEGGSVTLFAFDTGQGLKEHTTPFDALVLTLEGGLTLTIGGQLVTTEPGSIVRLPAAIPHAVEATAASRMLLIMLREPKAV